MPTSQASRPVSRRAVPAVKKRRETPYTMDTCVVRLTHEVKQHIISKARWGESIDQTLRRLFAMDQWNGKKGRVAGGK